jgi:hypothetical protein
MRKGPSEDAVKSAVLPDVTVPPREATGFDPIETADPAGYPMAGDDAREKPRPTARVAIRPS